MTTDWNPGRADGVPGGVDGRVVRLVQPLIGLDGDPKYRLVTLSARGRHLLRLVPIEGKGAAFLLARSEELCPEFVLALDEELRHLLCADEPEDLQSWALLAPHGDGAPTANLLAPLVINARRGLALQVVLEESGYPSALPIGPHESHAA